MNNKEFHQSNIAGYQGRDPKRPSLSLNYKTRSQGEYFPGHRSQARSSPSKNFGAPKKQGTFWNKQDPEKNLQRIAEENNTQQQ